MSGALVCRRRRAIDLFLGRPTREHADVDVAVFRDDQRIVREHLRGWELRKVVARELAPWKADEWLAVPVHEVHVRRTAGEPRELELLLNERAGDAWVFRRDPAVTLPISHAILRTDEGIPFLAPEIVLLYKSKNPRGNDARDLAAVLRMLNGERRVWFAAALGTVHPGHPWIAMLLDG